MVALTLQIVASFLILFSVLAFTTHKAWWIRATDFPRLQLAFVAALWLVFVGLYWLLVESIALHWLWPLLVFGVLLNHLWWVWPATILHKKEVLDAPGNTPDKPNNQPLPEISLLASNVLMHNRQAGALIKLVQDYNPDILATLESDHWWQSKLDSLDEYPHRLAHPLDNKYGMHVYSKLPLEECAVDFLVSDEIPSMALKVRLGDSLVRIHIVHPTPPAPGENLSSEDRDVELLTLAEFLKDLKEPIIVLGDLNDVAWSKTTRLFRSVSGLLDPRTGRGLFNTFHADYWFIRWPLDHMFVSNHWRLKNIQRLSHIGSDHFPVYIELALSTPLELEVHLSESNSDADLRASTNESDTAQDASKPSL